MATTAGRQGRVLYCYADSRSPIRRSAAMRVLTAAAQSVRFEATGRVVAPSRTSSLPCNSRGASLPPASRAREITGDNTSGRGLRKTSMARKTSEERFLKEPETEMASVGRPASCSHGFTHLFVALHFDHRPLGMAPTFSAVSTATAPSSPLPA